MPKTTDVCDTSPAEEIAQRVNALYEQVEVGDASVKTFKYTML